MEGEVSAVPYEDKGQTWRYIMTIEHDERLDEWELRLLVILAEIIQERDTKIKELEKEIIWLNTTLGQSECRINELINHIKESRQRRRQGRCNAPLKG